MKLDDRRREIMDLLIEQGSVALDDLAARFAVSKMTIHRDLDDLEAAGLLRKVRGGATVESSSRFESDYRYRERQAREEKRRIVATAAELLEPGMTVLVNDGSTAAMLAEVLPEKRPLTVITNNLSLIEALAGQSGIQLIAIGGTYSHTYHGFFGLVAEETLSNLRVDVAFVSTSAVDNGVAWHQDSHVVSVKRLMIAAGTRVYLLADGAKFGRTALHRLTGLGAFDALITGAESAPAAAEALGETAVPIIPATESRTP